jgi:hypothetical protein
MSIQDDLDRALADACDEIGCARDNEALLVAISELKRQQTLNTAALRACHKEIFKLRDQILMQSNASLQA